MYTSVIKCHVVGGKVTKLVVEIRGWKFVRCSRDINTGSEDGSGGTLTICVVPKRRNRLLGINTKTFMVGARRDAPNN